MKKSKFYKLGLVLGLAPVIGLCILFFISWAGRAVFATDIAVGGIILLYMMVSIPIIMSGFVLILVSLFKSNKMNFWKPVLVLILILTSLPLAQWILRSENEISRRAYLRIINNSGRDFSELSVCEPDAKKEFGYVKNLSDKIIFYQPDYASKGGIMYAGISENFLVMSIKGQKIRKRIPIIHPGEVHQILIDDKFNLTDTHLNKIIFRNTASRNFD